ncbi:MAG TPA: hypothetical protein VJ771_07235 [Candidatus Nitrosotalea sp.]|nr:hypothetical protein [Candidatus Nitrosotalea sp.]
MAQIKINLSGSEITIEFTDMKDFESQLEKIDLARIDNLLKAKKCDTIQHVENSEKKDTHADSKSIADLGIINILKISEKGQDAVKLAVFLSASGLGREEIKKITGITILSS